MGIVNIEQLTTKPIESVIDETYNCKPVGKVVARHGDFMLISARLPDVKFAAIDKVIHKSDETGNEHKVHGAVELYRGMSMNDKFGDSMYIVVSGFAEIYGHVEHGDATLPIGIYEIRQKRESRNIFRAVID